VEELLRPEKIGPRDGEGKLWNENARRFYRLDD
jgi:hypothetical protein